MHFIWALIVGLFVGALAKLLMPGKDPGGILITMLLGIAGLSRSPAFSAARSASTTPERRVPASSPR